MATVKANVVKKGVQASNTTSQGRSCTVTYIVSDLVGGTDPEGWIFDAMSASGIPALGSLLPDTDGNYPFLIAKSIDSVALGSGTQFSVVVRYGLPGPSDVPTTDPVLPENATVSVNSAVVETETAFDIDGQRIFTEHVDGKKVFGTVRYFASSTIIEYSRRESASPGDKSIKYTGAVNSDSQIFGGDGPRTWMCTYLGGPSDDGGQSWLVRYTFQRTPKIGKAIGGGGSIVAQPWDVLIIEQDPKTGDFVDNPEMGAGMKIVKVQREENFRQGLVLTI